MTTQGHFINLTLDGHPVKMHYHKQGNGAHALITFHGFGQSGRDMFPVLGYAKDLYTCYHVDIFFHGLSHWHEQIDVLTPSHWRALFSALLDKEDIDRFSLAAYSMGGKFALATVMEFAPKIDRIYLIAPDGIKTSLWYSLATYPLFFQRYFRSMIINPQRFFSLVEWAHRFGWIDTGMVRFVKNEMNSKKKRRRVYHSWVVFRKLYFPLEAVGDMLVEHGIGLFMVTGKYDKIIRTSDMHRLLVHVPHAKSVEVESGHNQLVNKSIDVITRKKF